MSTALVLERLVVPPSAAMNCIHCDYGLLDPPPLQRNRPLYQERLIQFAAGELRFCSCDAGKRYARWIGSATEREEKRSREESDLPKRMAAARQARVFENAGVPEKYAAYTLPGFERKAGNDPGKRDAIAALRHYEQHGHVVQNDEERHGLLLWGPPGVGKTGSLSPLFVQLVRSGRSGLWLQYNQFLADMRRFEDGQVDERMRACQSVDFLLIDDLGDVTASKAATDYTKDVLFRVIDHRVTRNLPILATTNLAPQELVEQFSARIARRLLGACAVVHMGGATLR